MEQEMIIHKSLLWDVTKRCNLNCTHCYNSGVISNVEDSYAAAHYKKVVDAMTNLGINHVHLLGGEPLLISELYDLIEYANFKNIYISINTNGTLLTDSVVKKLMEMKVLQVTISLDGAIEQDNDLIRGDGAFRLVTENVKRAIDIINQNQSDMIFQIATVITRQNIKSIHRIPRILKYIGVKNLDILKLYECGNAVVNKELLYVRPDEYIYALRKLLLESYRNGIFIQIDCKPKVLEILGNMLGFSVGLDSGFNKCPAANKILYMDCSGNIYPCAPIAHSITNVQSEYRLSANIFEDDYLQRIFDFNEIIQNRLSSNISICGICTDCHFSSQCSGCAICYNDYNELCEVACSLLSS